jgi:signal transduction histidine kinase
VLTHERFQRAPTEDPFFRELMAVRDITHAVLNADRPEDVFQFVLDRVAPLIGASFASIYLVDGLSELMRLAAAHNWPERYRPWLSDVRVRVGFGPSGEAAAERRIIEVPDISADRTLDDWSEVAQELGFRSLVALPMQTAQGVLGAATFYFADAGAPSNERRSLMRIVADQIAAAAEKARLTEALRRANAALADANVELERQFTAVRDARRAREEFLANVSHELRTPLTAVLGHIGLLQEEVSGPLTENQRHDVAVVKGASKRLLALIDDLVELSVLVRVGTPGEASQGRALRIEEFDPAGALQAALAGAGEPPEGVRLRLGAFPELRPLMRSDQRRVTRLLLTILRHAFRFSKEGEVAVELSIMVDRVIYRIQDSGHGVPAGSLEEEADPSHFLDGTVPLRYGDSGLGVTLAHQLTRLLGGEIEVVSAPGAGTTFTVELPLEYDPPRGRD